MSREALAADPQQASHLADWERQLAEHPAAGRDLQAWFNEHLQPALQAWAKKIDTWLPESRIEVNAGRPIPPMPERPTDFSDPQSPTVLYNANIAPLQPYAIRGVIWYQGETNAIYDRSHQYLPLFRNLIRDWRKAWGSEMPFLFVQLANHLDIQGPDPDRTWAVLRDAQRRALAEPNTAMAVTIDIGDRDLIHPANKHEVGRRLALGALNNAYGQDVVYSGPLLAEMYIEGKRCRLRFTHTDGGLTLRPGADTGFIIAGPDRRFHPAQVQLQDSQLQVWSEEVPAPQAVRYAWAADPVVTLFNGAGLPASPFRTVDWEITSGS
jgi:sialate O-acetylesterase